MDAILKFEHIESLIIEIRDQKVLLDRDVADVGACPELVEGA